MNPHPKLINYKVYIMKRAATSFPATVCSSTTVEICITQSIWGAPDHLPATSKKDLSEYEMNYIELTKSCFGNVVLVRIGSNIRVF